MYKDRKKEAIANFMANHSDRWYSVAEIYRFVVCPNQQKLKINRSQLYQLLKDRQLFNESRQLRWTKNYRKQVLVYQLK